MDREEHSRHDVLGADDAVTGELAAREAANEPGGQPQELGVSRNFADVRIKDYPHTLVENLKAGANPRIVVIDDLADVTVDTDTAAPLGLILNEVLSNCFKHAFPDGKAGTVTVSLNRVGDDRVELSVEDDGVGFNDAIPAKGIGRKLVAGFAKQLGGDFTFSSQGGSKFVLTFPGR